MSLHEKSLSWTAVSLDAGMLRGMDDQRDPHSTPSGKHQAPRALDPRKSLWTLWRDGVEWSCELVFRGESYGWEARVLSRGELFMSRRFILREPAVAWGLEQRRDIERGWVGVSRRQEGSHAGALQPREVASVVLLHSGIDSQKLF